MKARLAILLHAAWVLGFALLAGLGSVFVVLALPPKADGPWRMWPGSVAPGSGPYDLLHYLGNGQLLPDSRQRIDYRTDRDSDGKFLDSRCDYLLSGTPGPARWWSLEVEGNPADALLSDRLPPEGDKGVRVTLSVLDNPGNWLKLPPGRNFALVLRFHGPAGYLREMPLRVRLPVIERGDCG